MFDTVRELADAPPAVATEDSVSFPGRARGAGRVRRPLLYTEGFSPNFLPLTPLGGPPPGYECQRHDQALRDDRFKLVRRARATPWDRRSSRSCTTCSKVARRTRRCSRRGRGRTRHEQNNLLAAGATLSLEAALALQNLRDALAAEHASLLR